MTTKDDQHRAPAQNHLDIHSVDDLEFGGPAGCVFLILWSHYILFYFWYECCAFFDFSNFRTLNFDPSFLQVLSRESRRDASPSSIYSLASRALQRILRTLRPERNTVANNLGCIFFIFCRPDLVSSGDARNGDVWDTNWRWKATCLPVQWIFLLLLLLVGVFHHSLHRNIPDHTFCR